MSYLNIVANSKHKAGNGGKEVGPCSYWSLELHAAGINHRFVPRDMSPNYNGLVILLGGSLLHVITGSFSSSVNGLMVSSATKAFW